MSLYTCQTCGVVFEPIDGSEVKQVQDSREAYLVEGQCPGCGGEGVQLKPSIVKQSPEADSDDSDQNN